jgi:hypothetical protein
VLLAHAGVRDFAARRIRSHACAGKTFLLAILDDFLDYTAQLTFRDVFPRWRIENLAQGGAELSSRSPR